MSNSSSYFNSVALIWTALISSPRITYIHIESYSMK